MRAWLACVLGLSGCYLQQTVFDNPPPTPTIESAPAPVIDVPVGCITHEPSYRRRVSGKWWLGDHRVPYEAIDRALAAWPPAAPDLTRARRDTRLALGLFIGGFAITIGSLAGMIAWLHHNDQSREPLVMLAPAFSGYALGFAAVPVAIRGDHERRHAIDAFNDAAARENRCPP